MEYVIISPVKNEAQYLQDTIRSVCEQIQRPREWIIVDDGSSDRTAEIVSENARHHPWIKLVMKKRIKGDRTIGAPVIEAFYVGYQSISYKTFDFIVKLDGDLLLPRDYFKCVAEAFEKNDRLGLCGGFCVNQIGGKIVREKSAEYHIRGAFKSIRRSCWIEIGGFDRVLGWDGLDEMKALFKGWKTRVIESPVIHLRPTSSAYRQTKMAYRYGQASFQNGSNALLLVMRAVSRLKKRPLFIYSFLFVIGYLAAAIGNLEKKVNPELAHFINRFHFRRALAILIRRR